MHPLIVNRLKERLARLTEVLTLDPAGVEECRVGFAYALKDETLAYELLIDTDAFLFEAVSTFDITRKFVEKFFSKMFDQPVKFESALAKRGAYARWIKMLKDERNLFIHQTAQWPAIRIEEEGRFELVLLKKNVRTLEDTANYTKLADYFDVYNNFVASFPVIEAWLVEEIDDFEAAAPK